MASSQRRTHRVGGAHQASPIMKVPPGSSLPPARTPLAVKNVQSRFVENGNVDELGAASERAVGIKATTPKIKRFASESTRSQASSTRFPVIPSRLGAVALGREFGARVPQLVDAQTPSRKRSVPREDIHARNIVLDTDDGSPPHKRSRSSKDEEASSSIPGTGAESVSGSITSTIAKDMCKMEVGATHRGEPTSSALGAGPSERKSTDGVAPTRPTTTRIDKHSRLSAAERTAREESQRAQMAAWRKKYAYAFSKFAFYLDGFEEKQKSQMSRAIQHCGGRVEPFFDKTCTHVVSAHKCDALQDETQVNTAPTRLPLVASRKPETKRFSPSKKGLGRKNREVPLHSDRNPFEELSLASTGHQSSDVVRKATGWGIRVWSLDKFWSTIRFLVGQDGVSAASPNVKQDLAKMLEYERINGTSERDLTAPQTGWRYLDKRNIYILVGDATEEHHAIMFREFRSLDEPADAISADHRDGRQGSTPWPKLYGELEGRCPFTKYLPRSKPARGPVDEHRDNEQVAHDQLRIIADESRDPAEILAPAVEAKPAAPLSRLKMHQKDGRCTSISPAPGVSRVTERGASPYQLASGNSVSVASNITSTLSHLGSNASLTGSLHVQGGAGTPSFALQDKRVAQLNKRMVPSAAASHALPSSISGTLDSHRPVMPRSASLPKATDPAAHGALVRQMLGMTNEGSICRANGDGDRREGGLVRSASMQALGQSYALTGNAAMRDVRTNCVVPPVADRDRKTLYCENCRKKFHDFDKHINSHEHRKFAVNASNFAHVDELIRRLVRPLASWVGQPEYEHIIAIADNETQVSNESYNEHQSEDASDVFEDYIVEPTEMIGVPGLDGMSESWQSQELSQGVGCIDLTVLAGPSHECPSAEVARAFSPGDPLRDGQSFGWNTSYEGEGNTTPHTSPGAHEGLQDMGMTQKVSPAGDGPCHTSPAH